LLVNPGGPGVSGVDYARGAESSISSAVRRHYDIVGFDPRGVATSAPIRCLSDAQTDAFTTQDGSPDDSAEEAELVRLARLVGEQCAARNGGLLAHVGTRDVARDLDVLRGVLGDEKLNFLGKSYGTYIGAIYAEMFPDRVGRLVLDGVVDPAAGDDELARAQALGFERALASFVDDCLRHKSCPLSGDRASALGQVSSILEAADHTPLRAARPVTQSLVLLGIAYAMYEPRLWEVLREALAEAKSGNGSTLLLLADSYLERSSKGHYSSNGNDVIFAVSCLDRPETSNLAALRARAKALAAVAPRFGAYLAWGFLPCSFWPVPAEGKAEPVRAAGAAPILVVGTTRDPATPYAFAQNLAAELESGRLLTYDGDGHTAYEQGSGCIDDAVDAFLIDATLPAAGKRCR
jgi:pimeloyl-ACP methyl ester carboxylesterase